MMKNVYSVGQVNTYIKNMFAQDFMMQRISVKGEVSNCNHVCRKPPGALFSDEGG